MSFVYLAFLFFVCIVFSPFFKFYFILLFLAYSSSLMQFLTVKNAFLEFFRPIFHCQPLTDITVGSNLTQSSLYPFCTLAINSLQKIKLIALTLMLYVAYHAGYHLPFFVAPHHGSFPQSVFPYSGLWIQCHLWPTADTGYWVPERKTGDGWEGQQEK